MNADDVRLTAQLVVGRKVHCVSDESVEALARRVLELEADAEEHADNVRAVEREACAKVCDEADASYNAQADQIVGDTHDHALERHALRQHGEAAFQIGQAIRARGARASIGRGDPVQWEPVPDDVVLAVCVEYRERVVLALQEWFNGSVRVGAGGWRDVIDSVKMLGKPVRARGGK